MDASVKASSEVSPLSKKEQKEVKKHLKKVKRQLYRNLLRAYHGWWCWFWVCKTKGFGNTAVVLIPGDDEEISYLSLLYLDQMLIKRRYDNAIILSNDPVVIKSAKLFSKRILRAKSFNKKKVEALLQFYCLYEFNKKFICASLDKPYGRNGSVLIDKKGITKEEVFVIGVYCLYPMVKPALVEYSGNDSEIASFMSIGNKFVNNKS